MASETLDLRGLRCPLPLLRAERRMRTLLPGQELVLLATDPRFAEDLSGACERLGARLVRLAETDGVWTGVVAAAR
jgi:tRNA 2-thiouridine synthesizing protein A